METVSKIKSRIVEVLKKHRMKVEERRLNRFIERMSSIPIDEIPEELFELLVIENLTIGESYFFRDKKTFEKLKSILKSKPKWNILSIGCSRGEEVYSISIIAKEMGVEYNILGIDVNHQRIEEAINGCYRFWSIRFLSEHEIEKYFVKYEDKYCIKDEYKENTSFKVCNIGNCSALMNMKFDIIFIRRVLIYLDNVEKVLNIILNLLNDDGYLVIGSGEYFPEIYNYFEQVFDDTSAILRKIKQVETKEQLSHENTKKAKKVSESIDKIGFKGISSETQKIPKISEKITNIVKSQNFEEELRLIEHMIENKLYDESYKKIESLAKKYPTEHLVWKYKSLIEYELSMFEKAFDSIKKAMFLNHYDEEVWQLKHLLERLGRKK
ncbi:MAG: CheR family methyltransferase [Fervidobacterium nodosum]